MDIIRLDKNGNSARVAIHNGVAYFTGHVSREPLPTLKEQTAAVLARYDELFEQFGMKLHAALHACTTMNENQVQQTRQYGKI